MAYVGVEFAENGAIGLVHSNWLTPLKMEAFWPPYKTTGLFIKALTAAEEPHEDTWKICSIKRSFFECDDIEKAQKKLKKCEDNSDVHTTEVSDADEKRPKRKLKKNSILSSSSDEDSSEDPKSSLVRPPAFVKLKRTKIHSKSSLEKKKSIPDKSVETDRTEEIASSASLCEPSTSSAFRESRSDGYFTPSSAKEHPIGQNLTGVTDVNSIHLEKIYNEVKKLREEVKEIKVLLKQSGNCIIGAGLPSDIPVQFPLVTDNSFKVLEEYLNIQDKRTDLASYFSTLGGGGTTGQVNRILRLVFTNSLATHYNFAGQRKSKQAFKDTHLKAVIIRAIQIKSPATTETDIEAAIKIWLKHAKQRLTRKQVAQQN